jgi:hypothetical protein
VTRDEEKRLSAKMGAWKVVGLERAAHHAMKMTQRTRAISKTSI